MVVLYYVRVYVVFGILNNQITTFDPNLCTRFTCCLHYFNYILPPFWFIGTLCILCENLTIDLTVKFLCMWLEINVRVSGHQTCLRGGKKRGQHCKGVIHGPAVKPSYHKSPPLPVISGLVQATIISLLCLLHFISLHFCLVHLSAFTVDPKRHARPLWKKYNST